MAKFTQKIKKTALSILAAFLAILPLANITPASALVDTPWGPDRTTFTWADPAPYATFNSITDNPQLGDERNFVRVREVADGNLFGDEVTVTAGKTYEVYIYYHNNADAHDVGKTAIGIADGVAMKSSFPATVMKGEKATVTGIITAADTSPLSVWDGAYLIGGEDVYLRYVPGTATIHNGGQLNGQNIGPDYLFGDGALLGYNQFSGLLPGCNEYAGYVTYQIFADAPNFEVTKSIISDTTDVKVGDEVTFKVRYQNTGTMDQLNVVVRDTIPEGLTYIPGSTMLYNNNLTGGKVVNDDLVTENGMNIGDYAGGSGWAEVTYRAKVDEGLKCGGTLTNTALVSTTDGNKTASVTLTVTGENCTPPTSEDCTTNPNLPGCSTPTKEDCNTNPNLPGCDLPTEIVNTGPLEIVMAIIVVLGIAGAGFYLWRTKRTLKTVENVVSGETPSATNASAPKPESPASNPETPQNPEKTETSTAETTDNHNQEPENNREQNS